MNDPSVRLEIERLKSNSGTLPVVRSQEFAWINALLFAEHASVRCLSFDEIIRSVYTVPLSAVALEIPGRPLKLEQSRQRTSTVICNEPHSATLLSVLHTCGLENAKHKLHGAA